MLFSVASLVLAVCSCSQLDGIANIGSLPLDYQEALPSVAPETATRQTLSANLTNLMAHKNNMFKSKRDPEEATFVCTLLIDHLVRDRHADISAHAGENNTCAIDHLDKWVGTDHYDQVIDTLSNGADKSFCKNWQLPVELLKRLELEGQYQAMDDVYNICPHIKVDAATLAMALQSAEDCPELTSKLVSVCSPEQLEILFTLPIISAKHMAEISNAIPGNKKGKLSASRTALERNLESSGIAKPYTFESLIDWASQQSEFDESTERMFYRILSADTSLVYEPELIQKAIGHGNETVISTLLNSMRTLEQQRTAIATLQMLDNCAEQMNALHLPMDYCTCALSQSGLGDCIRVQ